MGIVTRGNAFRISNFHMHIFLKLFAYTSNNFLYYSDQYSALQYTNIR